MNATDDVSPEKRLKEAEEIKRQMKVLEERLRCLDVQSVLDNSSTGASSAPATTSTEEVIENNDRSGTVNKVSSKESSDIDASIDSTPSAQPSSMLTPRPADWASFAFGTCASDLEWETRLDALQTSMSNFRTPPVNSQDRLKIGEELSLRGKLCRQKNVSFGSMKTSPRGKIDFQIIPLPESIPVGVTLSDITATNIKVIESKVGSKCFEKLARALHTDYDDDQLLWIGIKPQMFPSVQCMDGTVINFPMRDNSYRRLLTPFSDAWFCPLQDSTLSKEQKHQLSSHLAAYRISGGVIYLGLNLKPTEPSGFEVENIGIKLSREQLDAFRKKIESICNSQRPVWNVHDQERILNDCKLLKQLYDECFISYFTTIDDRSTSSKYYVIRIVVCPSKQPLHLAKEKHIKLRRRLGETSKNYAIEDFIAKMSETSSEMLHELARMPPSASQSPCIPTNIKDVCASNPLPLWSSCPTERGFLENKECRDHDPVTFTIEKLTDYAATWLNDSIGDGGTLRIGVADKTSLATGIWLDEDAERTLKIGLTERFQGSHESKSFCFPRAIDYLTLKKNQIFASTQSLLSKSSKVLVLWLKVPHNSNCRNGFEPYDKIRRDLYSSWLRKTFMSLYDLKSDKYTPLLLPLNASYLKDLKQPLFGPTFAVGISKPAPDLPNPLDSNQLVCNLEKELTSTETSVLSQLVYSYQFVDAMDVTNILDSNYCTLDVIVRPAKSNLFHLCELPIFWKLEAPSTIAQGQGHIGKCPTQMNFQEIVLRCDVNSLPEATRYLSNFFHVNDRPILITDICPHEPRVIEGIAKIPWTLVLDFDFEVKSVSVDSKSLRVLAQEDPPYIYKIVDLLFNEDFSATSDVRPVYWVKALGPSNERIIDHDKWCLRFEQRVAEYIKQACRMITSKVKVVVVWSTDKASSGFGHAVRDLCLAAQQAQPLNPADVVVVSPAAVSPFLSSFRNRILPHPAVFCSMELHNLSGVLIQTGPSSATSEEISVQWRRVPGNEKGTYSSHLLPVETVRSMKLGELVYLYPKFDEHLVMDEYDDGLAFFAGRTYVRWEDFKAKNVVKRDETDTLFTLVRQSLRNRRDTEVINFRHEPGAGGSTIARNVLWRMRNTFCCVIPCRAYHNLRNDVEELVVASEGRAALVLWDTNMDIEFDTLKSRLDGLHVVILRVERFVKMPDHISSTYNKVLDLEEWLTQEVLDKFVSKLSNDRNYGALCALKLHASRGEKVPLFLVMVTALENEFVLLDDYVKNKLINVTESLQRQLLVRIAFTDIYTSRHLQERALSVDTCSYWKTLPFPNKVLDLIAFDGQHTRCIRMRHNCIAKIVLSELTKIKDDTSNAWGYWLAEFVVDFMKHLGIVYPVPEFDSLGNNEYEIILRRLFHGKSDHTQGPYFLSLIGSLAGKEAVIDCMREVDKNLPQITRIRAHFLADLARVHLNIDCNDTNLKDNLKDASSLMAEAHKLLPDDRTLYHQEGQLYIDAMPIKMENSGLLPVSMDLLEKRAMEIIELAQHASTLFAKSRNCKLQGRTNALYPWESDVNCYLQCLENICSLLKRPFDKLPDSLKSHNFVKNAWEEVMYLLETLSTENTVFWHASSQRILFLIGTKDDQNNQLRLYLKEIDGIDSLDDDARTPYTNHSNPKKLATILRHTTFFLRAMYSSARRVPQNICTRLTLAIIWLIQQPRLIGSFLAQPGHAQRFFELELLWEWSRYSNQPPSPEGMASIIGKFKANASTHLLLKAKCLFFEGVTRLLQLLCNNDVTIDPQTIMNPIKECNRILQDKQLIWKYHEFLINGHGNGVLSSKDWTWNRSLDREVNDSSLLDRDYDKSPYVSFREFSGRVQYMSSDGRKGDLACKGLKLFFVPRHAPSTCKVNGEESIFVSISSHQGLRAHPKMSPDDKNSGDTRTHQWLLNLRFQKGRIVKIDKKTELVYLEPHPYQPYYEALAVCRFIDIPSPYKEGYIFEFTVDKVPLKPTPSYFAYNCRRISPGNKDKED